MEVVDVAAQLGTDDDQKIVGVGIVFVDGADGLVVESLVPGSGAAACGDVLVGDKILTIQGEDVSGQPAAEIAKLVAGPVGDNRDANSGQAAQRRYCHHQQGHRRA